jgi:hypothetical protein
MMEVGMDGKRVIGIDIGKRWLDVAREGTAAVEQHRNEASAIAALVGSFDPTRDIVVFEQVAATSVGWKARWRRLGCPGRRCIRRRSRPSARFKPSKSRRTAVRLRQA